MFTVANNGVGLPMDTSKFEKFSQEQYDAVYKKLADGEIGLVQFSADNNDPNEGFDRFDQYKGYLCGVGTGQQYGLYKGLK